MKKMMVTLGSSAMIFILASAPTLAQRSHDQTREERNECLLASKNCVNEVDDIYKRMHRLDKEIRKGTKVYTPAELRKLQEKLHETDQMLRQLEEGE
jgi:hypothetical protein